jgi:predicted DCC family thiol-disulfide oxidoreductase YuxK
VRHDRHRIFRFASLQGETAKRMVPTYAEEAGLSTVVLITDDGEYVRSTAVARVLKRLGGFWSFLGSFMLLLPKAVRDWGYRLVSRNRYRIFGKKDSCRLPTPAERELFLP